MKQLLIVPLVVIMLTGCATVRYTKTTEDGKSEFVYTRVLNQKIEGLKVVKGVEVTEVHLDSQEAQNDEVLRLVRKIAGLMEQLATKIP